MYRDTVARHEASVATELRQTRERVQQVRTSHHSLTLAIATDLDLPSLALARSLVSHSLSALQYRVLMGEAAAADTTGPAVSAHASAHFRALVARAADVAEQMETVAEQLRHARAP